MTSQEVAAYIDTLLTRQRPPFYLERLFRTNEEWEQLAAHDLRHFSLSSRTEATLDGVLGHPYAVVLGEPGLGKSTVARAALDRVVARGEVPVIGNLRSYAGNLRDLLAQSTPEEILASPTFTAAASTRVFILDGLDEIPQGQLGSFLTDLDNLYKSDPTARILLTSRQAFYAAHRSLFKRPPEAFVILGFRDRDIEQYVTELGVPHAAFLTEVERVGLDTEITNPFALDVLARAYRDQGSLGPLKYQSVDHVVESLIATRPGASAERQRRALRMIAVTMETAARNELTLDEAVQLLQAAMRLTPDDAQRVIDELLHSILVRTPNGIAFQMRSYGEYLAARELSDRPLDNVFELVMHPGTRIPNESWRNAVSYLAELNGDVRRYFSRRHPEWMVAASANAFFADERTVLLKNLLGKLALDRQYLVRHPVLASRHVARLATSADTAWLTTEANDPDPIKAANAMLVLGACGNAGIIPEAMRLAVDRTRTLLIRSSALAALSHAGDRTLIPTLAGALDPNDPLYLSVLDAIGSLMGVADIPDALPLFLRPEALISSAFYRFRDFRTPDAVGALLSTLTANPDLIRSSRLNSYAEPLWEVMGARWDPQWAPVLASLVVTWERAHVYERDLDEVRNAIRTLPDGGSEVGRLVLQGFLQTGTTLTYSSRTVASLVTEDVARWLVTQPNARDVMQTVAFFGTPEVRAILAPHLGGLIEAQDARAAEMQQEEATQAEQERQELEAKKNTVLTAPDLTTVLQTISTLEPKDWPSLNDERREWMRAQVAEGLAKCDSIRKVTWTSDNQLTLPPILWWLVRLIGHYDLAMPDDVLVAQSLIAGEESHIAAYYQRHGFSPAAIQELERIVGDPTTPNGATEHVLRFLQATDVTTRPIVQALLAIAADARRMDYSRSGAARMLDKRGATDDELVDLAKRIGGKLANDVEDTLVERQHLPAIHRRLAALLGDDAAVRAGEVTFPFDSPLSWIGKIKTQAAWDRLVQLREQTLRLNLPNVATLVTQTLRTIDPMKAVAVVREQIPSAPADWREVQQVRALEFEREARLQKAQATPFAEIVQRLRRTTTLGLFKIRSEGPTDGPTLEQLLQKFPDAGDRDIVTEPFGGYANIRNPSWPVERLWDGCRDVLVILDGDNGRDYTKPGHPLSAQGEAIRARLTEVGVDLHILERRGMENYFTKAAVEKVHGPVVAAQFPLPPDGKAVGFNKNRNAEVARAMTLADIAGTDLGQVLQTIIDRSG